MGGVIGGRITVAGAGIAGLAAALALARRGARVRVVEAADRLRTDGAGIQISPNGAVVLEALGLGDVLRDIGTATEAVVLRDGATARTVLRLPLAQGYRLTDRGALVAALARAVDAAGVGIETGTGWRPAGASGFTVAADGIGSAWRAAVAPGAAPRFTGQVAWRAVIEGAGRPEAEVFVAPGRHLVSYPLPGGRRTLVAVEERRGWAAEGWRHADDPAHLRAAFAGFGGPVPGWLAAVPETHLWGLFLHPPAARWTRPGAVLVGDAAHPMLPFLAQGANMALEDAWVLAACLDAAPDLDAGAAAFAARRRARVARVVRASARNARLYHLGGPARALAHAALRAGGARLAPGFGWLHGFDVTRGTSPGAFGGRG